MASERHGTLENLGMRILLVLGYDQKDIIVEKPIQFNSIYGGFMIRPDLYVGKNNIKNLPSIAVECGECTMDKLYVMRKIFERVLILPFGLEILYGDDNPLETIIKQLQEANSKLESELNEIKNNNGVWMPVSNVTSNSNDTQQKKRVGTDLILSKLKERSYAFNELCSSTNISSATLARRLNELMRNGQIERTEETGHAKWKLVENNI